jgi:dipeptidyl aminopeptidase/acylaminoacyl peptidase
MTPVGFPARDGLPLHGFLILAVGIEPMNLPLVLLVHGGPWMHDAWGYNRAVQFLASLGYAVLQVNFRGSTGCGRRHVTAAIGEFAGAMHDDLIDAVDWAIAQGYADPDRVAIAGSSYGGYAALVGVTVTPDRFAAAVGCCRGCRNCSAVPLAGTGPAVGTGAPHLPHPPAPHRLPPPAGADPVRPAAASASG